MSEAAGTNRPRGASTSAGPSSGHPVPYEHLLRLTDDVAIFEHADRLSPRTEHGYCVDDVARALIVVLRDPSAPAEVAALAARFFSFVVNAVAADGRVHNRRAFGHDGWTDEATVYDCWGRAVWALGTTVALSPGMRGRALEAFDRAAGQRSPFVHSMAYAGLGAAEVLRAEPDHGTARTLLGDAAAMIDTRTMASLGASTIAPASNAWPWPESRLRYANGVFPELLLAAGQSLPDSRLLNKGLALLEWLLGVETAAGSGGGHLSVTPVGGWAPGEARPGFDQQPIEVAALAEACARAAEATGDVRWHDAVRRCEEWFDGRNDVGIPLADYDSGGGCDGLKADGRNENQGAESTLALLSVRQLARKATPSIS